MTNGGDNDTSMIDLFFSELRDQASTLRKDLKALSSGTPDDETFESLFRICHSIKGAARIVQYDNLFTLAHAMEGLMHEIGHTKEIPSQQIIAVFENAVTALEELGNTDSKDAGIYLSDNEANYHRLIEKLKIAKERLKGEGSEEKEIKEKPPKDEKIEESLLLLNEFQAVPEEIEPEMTALFQKESHAHFNIIEAGLKTLKEDPSNLENLEALMHTAHQVVETSRIVAFKGIELTVMAIEQQFHYAISEKKALTIEAIEGIERIVELIKPFCELSKDKILEWLKENAKTLFDDTEILKEAIPSSTKKTKTEPRKAEKTKRVKATVPIPAPKKRPSTYDAEKEALRTINLDLNMMGLFLVEMETQVNVLSNGLIKFEQNPDDTDLIEPLMRAAHSIKGAGKVVNLEPLVHLAHAMEDCFVAAQRKELRIDEYGVDLLLQSVDVLESVRKIPVKNIPAWIIQEYETIASLVECVTALSTGEAAEPEAYVKTVSQEEPAIEEMVTQNVTPPPEEEIPVEPVKAVRHRKEENQDRVLRVTAQSLNRLMGLAGESLVESRWLQPFSDALLKFKKIQNQLSEQFDTLWEILSSKGVDERTTLTFDEIKMMMNECRSNLNDRLNELEMFIRRHSSLSDRLYREVIDSRMRPFSDGVEAFPRMLRDIARELGKKVRLEVFGKTTQVDREILEKLEAPLSHLLRNAVDHGIELPEERVAKGKSPEGVIKVEAFHQAGMLAITVSDDGKGIDLPRLRDKVVNKRLVTADMAKNLSEAELLDFLFLPGFSTREEVTKISGRGVGLDVVQSMVQEVGGHIRVQAKPDGGTAFYLHLPLTLSVIRALLVEISGEPFAFPLARIDRAIIVADTEMEIIENRQYFTFEGQNVGLVPLFQVLGMNETTTEDTSYPVVVISDRSNSYGAVVDKFLGERELVVQELDPRLGKIPDITAGALMEDGDPVLIMDVEDLVRSIDTHLSGGRLKRLRHGDENKVTEKKRVLVIDDSITVREVECRLLENKGYEVETAVNGVDGWNAVRIGHYDLVITDVDMPRMNGIELTKAIKQDERLRSMPVMIVSYKEREEDRILGLEAGADYYLTKSSFHDETLITAVEDMIGKP